VRIQFSRHPLLDDVQDAAIVINSSRVVGNAAMVGGAAYFSNVAALGLRDTSISGNKAQASGSNVRNQ
jgi:hypothetical protein